MKIKKILLFFLLIFSCSILFSCKDDKVPTTSVSTQEKEVLFIVVDTEQKTVFQGEEYTIDVKVIATFDDYTVKEVTDEAAFSSYDTNVIGEQTITVTYETKTTSFKLIVLENEVSKLLLDYSNAKRVYKISEKFDSKLLTVKCMFKNGRVEEIDNYTVKIINNQNEAVDFNVGFNETGYFNVEITYKGKKAFYTVVVYKNDYDVSFNVSSDYFKANYDFGTGNEYKFTPSEEVLFQNDYLTYSIAGSNSAIQIKDSNGNQINESFDNKTYQSRLFIADENSVLKLKLNKNSHVILVGQSYLCDNVLVVKNETSYSNIGNYNGQINNIYLYLEAGEYELAPINGGMFIYDIIVNFDEPVGASYYENIILDTSLVKKNYEYLEEFTTNGLIVYGLSSTGERIAINSDEYIVSIYFDAKQVEGFKETGTYEIRIDYIGSVECNINRATYSVYYSKEKLETTYIGKITIDDVNINAEPSIFTYVYNVSSSTTSVYVIATSYSTNSVVSINGKKAEGSVGNFVELQRGQNEVVITVTNTDDVTATYTVIIIRE